MYLQAHLAPENAPSFDFQNYISRSLEEDFKVVVGIRFVLSTSPKLIAVISYSFDNATKNSNSVFAVLLYGSLQCCSCCPIHMVSSASNI